MYHNKVTLVGHVCRDPELKYTPNGSAVAKATLGMTRKYTTQDGSKKEDTTFVDVDFFGKVAEVLAKFVRKGDPVLVHGRLKLDQWDDKKTGEKRSKLSVFGEELQLMSRPSPGAEQGQQPPAQSPAPQPAQAAPAPAVSGDADSDDVPF